MLVIVKRPGAGEAVFTEGRRGTAVSGVLLAILLLPGTFIFFLSPGKGGLVAGITMAVLSIYRPILEPMGLTHPQYLVMLALWGHSPLAVKELIDMLQLDSPTLSPMLKRLEAAGLVTRARDPHDERQLRVDLTEKGRAPRQQALNVPPTVVAKLGMSLGEHEELHRGLTTLNDAARRANIKPLPASAKDSI